MDYFQELLTSYQKLKKRTFRVSYIVEQEQDAMSAYSDAANRATGLVSRGVIPIDQGEKLGVGGVITAYTSKTKEGIVPGLAMSDKTTPIPGSQNYAVRLSTIANNQEVQNKIGLILLGQKSDSEQQDQSQEQDQAAQADATEPVMTPEMLAQQEYQNSLINVFSKAKDLVIGKFFKSILNKATGEVQIDPVTGGKKQFRWLQYESDLQEYFLSNKPQSLSKKLDEAITESGQPLLPEQKQEIVDTAFKFLEIGQKVSDGTASREELLWVKTHIQTGANYSDKRTIRIKSKDSDLHVTFKWHGGVGITKDTQFWRHMLDSYDEAVESWAKNQVPAQDIEEFKIDRVSVKEMATGTGQLNAIRGFFAENFIPISMMLSKATLMQSTDPERAQAHRAEAIKLFTDEWNKNGEAILKAFGAYESFIGEGVAVDDATLSELNDFKELAETFNMSISESKIKGMSPDQIKKLAGVLTMNVAKSLILLDSQFSLRLNAEYVSTTGRATSNGKKTDLVFIFKNKDQAIEGLRRAGISDSEINKFLLNSDKAKKLFAGTETEDFLNKVGPEGIAVPIGIKTYNKEKGITLGTTSAKEALSTLSDKDTGQANTIRKELQTNYGSNTYKQHEKNVETLTNLTKSLDDLKWNPRQKEIPKATLSKVKSIIGPRSDKWRDLQERIDAYKKDPTSDLELRHDINKFLDDEKRDLIMDRIKKGIKTKDESWRCTLDGFLRSTGSAAEQNQITVSRFMKENRSYSMDHNSAIDEISSGLADGSITLNYSANGLQFIVNCKGRKVCDEDHYGSLNMNEGKFEFESTLNSVKRHHNRITSGKKNESTDLGILDFLLEQKRMLDNLIAKYQ
jgi:hypothetical protein